MPVFCSGQPHRPLMKTAPEEALSLAAFRSRFATFMVATALCGSPVRGREQSVDLRLFRDKERPLCRFFERYRADLPRPFDMYWAMFANEAREGANGGEPLVACSDGAVA
jgi:hypothetical protein